jgi:hypothetical protein
VLVVRRRRNLAEQEDSESSGEYGPLEVMMEAVKRTDDDVLPSGNKFAIAFTEVRFGERLGEGQFGTVYKGAQSACFTVAVDIERLTKPNLPFVYQIQKDTGVEPLWRLKKQMNLTQKYSSVKLN